MNNRSIKIINYLRIDSYKGHNPGYRIKDVMHSRVIIKTIPLNCIENKITMFVLEYVLC
jgi:hypothetical protein